MSDSDSEINLKKSNSQGTYTEVDITSENLDANDFIFVEFTTRKNLYVGRIEKMESDGADVKITRKKTNETFIFPETDDISRMNTDDILLKLLPPTIIGGTHRAASSSSLSVKLR